MNLFISQGFSKQVINKGVYLIPASVGMVLDKVLDSLSMTE